MFNSEYTPVTIDVRIPKQVLQNALTLHLDQINNEVKEAVKKSCDDLPSTIKQSFSRQFDMVLARCIDKEMQNIFNSYEFNKKIEDLINENLGDISAKTLREIENRLTRNEHDEDSE